VPCQFTDGFTQSVSLLCKEGLRENYVPHPLSNSSPSKNQGASKRGEYLKSTKTERNFI
jgi:hypothetical protein